MSNDIASGASADAPVVATNRKNHHIADAIRQYCEFPHPQRHALLISGKWGSGKTHLLEEVGRDLSQRASRCSSGKPLYITLYGVKDAAEIGEQIYQQMHPFLASKGVRFVSAIMKGILKTTVKIDLSELHKGELSLASQLPDVKVSELLDGASRRVIIFDDFERAVMSPVELLGYINAFVEHDGCKVIILANEEAIEDTNGKYKERKEKTVGQTLEIAADAEAAFSAFLAEIDTPDLRAYYERHKLDIVAVFADSNLHNLRLLKQFLWEFEKLWQLLTPDQRQHDLAISEIMCLLFAWTLEIRSNRIDSATLALESLGVDMALVSGQSNEGLLSYSEMTKRYPTVRFDSALLSRETIKGIVMRSEFPVSEIQEQLRAHPYFIDPSEVPSWKLLWNAHELPAETIPLVMCKFNDDFANRRYTDEREILHVAGLCLWISDLGQLGWDAGTVVTKIKSYIDDVYNDRPSSAADVVTPRDLHRQFGGAFGLTYRNANDSRFKEISEYLQKKVADWRGRGLPAAAVELLALMSRDSGAFLHQVCATAVGPSTYARLPVLGAIAPDQFVAAFIRHDANGRRDILLALAMRYEHVDTDPVLRGEQLWLGAVHSGLVAYANELDPIPRGALKQWLEAYFGKILPVSRKEAHNSGYTPPAGIPD